MMDRTITVNEARALTHIDLREIWTYRDLLMFLIRRDIKVRYKQAAMGAAWAIIQPVLMMLVFAVFFGIFIGVFTDNMPIYALLLLRANAMEQLVVITET